MSEDREPVPSLGKRMLNTAFILKGGRAGAGAHRQSLYTKNETRGVPKRLTLCLRTPRSPSS